MNLLTSLVMAAVAGVVVVLAIAQGPQLFVPLLVVVLGTGVWLVRKRVDFDHESLNVPARCARCRQPVALLVGDDHDVCMSCATSGLRDPHLVQRAGPESELS